MATLAIQSNDSLTTEKCFMDLPTDEEKKQIEEMRALLKEDLATAVCASFPEIVSDFKFIRYLRGYGSVEEGVKAYRKMLTTRAKYTHVDEMRKLIGEDIENTGINGKQPDFLKYAKDENEKKVLKFADLEKVLWGMTADGIPYTYRCYANMDPDAAFDGMGGDPTQCADLLEKFGTIKGVLNELKFDALSRKSGKVARLMWIADSTGLSFAKIRKLMKGKPWDKEFAKRYPKDEEKRDPWDTFMPEIGGIIILMNIPWCKYIFFSLKSSLVYIFTHLEVTFKL